MDTFVMTTVNRIFPGRIYHTHCAEQTLASKECMWMKQKDCFQPTGERQKCCGIISVKKIDQKSRPSGYCRTNASCFYYCNLFQKIPTIYIPSVTIKSVSRRFKEPPATSNDSEKNLVTRNNPEQDLAVTKRGILGHNNYKKKITDGDCEELLRVQEELHIKTLMKLNALVFLVKPVLFFFF